ncbi:hypothetical protein GCM10009113_05280 [Marinobacter szutsaonensis]
MQGTRIREFGNRGLDNKNQCGPGREPPAESIPVIQQPGWRRRQPSGSYLSVRQVWGNRLPLQAFTARGG